MTNRTNTASAKAQASPATLEALEQRIAHLEQEQSQFTTRVLDIVRQVLAVLGYSVQITRE